MENLARSRRAFVILSRLMAPLIRRGLLPSTRLGGSLCVLRTRGRKSGAIREAALDYAVAPDAGIWVMAGWGAATQWYRNLVADPWAEVIVGRRTRRGLAETRRGRAETITDPAERVVAMRAVLRASGLAGRAAGFDPATATDERLAAAFDGFPVVHVRFD